MQMETRSPPIRNTDMKYQSKISSPHSLLFTYSIESSDNPEKEILIASKNVTNDKELAESFIKFTKPEFTLYGHEERQSYIDTSRHFLKTNEDFEAALLLFDTYFDDEVIDKNTLHESALRSP